MTPQRVRVGVAFLIGIAVGGVSTWWLKSVLPTVRWREVVTQLSSADPVQRSDAAWFFAMHPAPQAAKALTQALLDDDDQVRLAAAVALTRLGDPALAPLLNLVRRSEEEARRDPQKPVHFLPGQFLRRPRDAAVFILSQWAKSSQKVHLVTRLLTSQDPLEVSIAQDALRQGGAPAMRAVLPLLQHKRREVRLAALSVLGAYGDAAVDTIGKFLTENGQTAKTPADQEVRQIAVYVLGGTQSDRAFPFLKQALKDPQLAPAAWQAIGKLGTATAKRFLLEQAHRFAKEQQMPPTQLVVALGSAQVDDARPLILQWLNAPAPRVQEAAALAAGMMRMQDAVPVLIRLLNAADIGVAAAAANALGIIGDPRSFTALCHTLTQANQPTRWQVVVSALSALQSLRRRDAVPAIEQLLKTPNLPPLVRQQAEQTARYLRQFGQ